MTERTDSQKAAEIAAIRALSAPEQTELARLLIANLSNSASDTVKRRFVKGLEPLDQILFLKDLKDEGASGAVLERTPASDFVAAKDQSSYSPARAAMIAEAEANSPDNGRPHGQKAEPANVLSPERLAMIAEAEANSPDNWLSQSRGTSTRSAEFDAMMAEAENDIPDTWRSKSRSQNAPVSPASDPGSIEKSVLKIETPPVRSAEFDAMMAEAENNIPDTWKKDYKPEPKIDEALGQGVKPRGMTM